MALTCQSMQGGRRGGVRRVERRGARHAVTSTLTALGLSPEEERAYQQLLPLSGGQLSDVASVVGEPVARLPEQLAALVERGLVSLDDGRLSVLPVPALVTHLIAEQADAADRTRERLRELAQAIPFLVATAARPGPGQMDELGNLDGELSAGGNALHLLTDLIETSKGDLLWWRPDAWLLPREAAISVVVGRAVASGRRSRAIYPLRALHEAPEVLLARARQGEQVRVIDEMPTRMLVIRGTHAILPEPLGFADEPRLLVRQPAIVGALTLLFEPTGTRRRRCPTWTPDALASTSAAGCCASSRPAPRTSRSRARSGSACAPSAAGSPT